MRSSQKPGVVRMLPSAVHCGGVEPGLLAQLAPRAGLRRFAGRQRAGRHLPDEPAGGVAELRISVTSPCASTATTAARPDDGRPRA